MIRTSTIATLAVLSSILTPVVVKATDGAQSRSAPVQQAKVETAAMTTPASSAQEPACTRKVKVVYAGYGEGRGAACAATADMRR
jgi:hypothetical protein